MTALRLRLLGPMQLELPGAAALGLPWQRPGALLAWLACTDDWLPREQLATRLRPDADPETARAYLRRLLHRVRERHPAAAAGLEVEPLRLRWTGSSDVREFRAACDTQDWERALVLHAQPLLVDAPPLGEAAIDDWLDDERLALRRRWRTALGSALQIRAEAGNASGALALMQRLVDDDPLDEEGVQWVLARAAAAGADEAQRRVALQAYEAMRRRLALEMALKPLPATDALAQALRDRREAELQAALHAPRAAQSPLPARSAAPAAPAADTAGPPATQKPPASGSPVTPALALRRQPPVDAGPLLGRAADLDRLRVLLAQPGPRWITLLGPGGIGKTRLAAALARADAQRWRDGVVWVPLAGVDDAAGLHDSLAAALGLPPGEGRTAERLAAALAERESLMVLDNLEQLQPQAAALHALMAAAPMAQWIATSREALGLPAEHRWVLDGLATEGEAAPALALLSAHAARHGAPLDLADPGATKAAQQLLRAVRGLPLAIELAAAWLPVMTLPDLAAAVGENPGHLDAGHGTLAPEARSLRGVFLACWRRLDFAQQRSLGALSVLHGSFDRAAAQAVARCDAAALLQLAGKSLLQREGAGVFALHPLVRQFAAESVAALPQGTEMLAEARRRHAQHHLGRLAAAPPLRPGHGPPQAVAALLEAMPDIAAAWRHATELGDVSALTRAQPQMEGLLALAGRFDEALALADLACDRLPAGHRLRLQLDAWRVASLVSLDRSDACERLARELLARDAAAALPAGVRGTATAVMTRLAYQRGDTEAALGWALQAVAAAGAAHDEEQRAGIEAPPVAQMRSLQNLAAVHWARGDLQASEATWTRMHALALEHDSPRQEARALRGLGVILQQRGALDEAMAVLARAASQFEVLGDTVELSQVQRSASFVLRDLRRHAEQLDHARAAVSSGEGLGLPTLQGANLFALGLACEDNGDTAAAGRAYRRCLLLARRQQMPWLVLRCVFTLASLHAATGQCAGDPAARAEALGWLHFARAHPALRATDREEIDVRLAALAPTGAETENADAAATRLTLETIVPRLLR